MRAFIGQADPEDPSILLLTSGEARHAFKVARLKPGGMARVLAAGRSHECSVIEISSSLAKLRIESTIRESGDSGPRITLAQGIVKGKAMDDIVRVASELGAAEIIPLLTGRVEGVGADKTIPNRVERWRSIAASAAKVSSHPLPCAIHPPMTLAHLAEMEADLKLAFWEDESHTLKSILRDVNAISSVLIVIGPEGGFSEEEAASLRAMGIRTASLGSRILRARTAGAAAILAVQYHFSE
ncbi:MAG: 16S rRNA (uracil(1498)-N(3))-methyltransferase [Nitrospinota bacterium]|nr:16S rRNA (uracil(1498)-N(3))-methyltransferase [Nitrospinota bacterium]